MKHALAVIMLVIGCGTSVRTTMVATSLQPPPRRLAPRTVESVEVFLSGPPQRPYVDLALLEGEQSSSYSMHETPEILGAIRERAAQLGCDGIVFRGVTSRTPGLGDPERLINDEPTERKGIVAVCIAYRELTPGELAQVEGYERAQVERTKQRAYQACLDRQLAIGKRADTLNDPRERTRLLRSVPVCTT